MTDRRTRSWWRPRAARTCAAGSTTSSPTTSSKPPSSTATSPASPRGEDLILLHEDGSERTRFTFPRQRRGRRLCLADFFRPEESGETDVIGLQIVTVGSRIGEATAELFAANSYRDYLELHGLSVQLAEALAEYW
ncbi:5-methyltetrahydrofolate--homocysteine methyltransferase, partial [Streptomyces sp. Ncost-T6T-2b]